MDVYVVLPGGLEHHPVDELRDLLGHPELLVWVDIASCDEQAVGVLSEVFGFHPIAVRNCVERNHVSKVHLYADHVFTVLHAPHIGKRGHVHYIELDEFIGQNYLVTIHGPVNAKVDPVVTRIDVDMVRRRLENSSLKVEHPYELSYAIVSALARRESDLVAKLAEESGQLEQSVTSAETREDPEAFIEDLFEVWYELLAIRTMADHASATYGRVAGIARGLPEEARSLVLDIQDQFQRVRSMADGQREFLHGVIEFYKTRADTHTAIASERSAETAVQQNDDMRKITAWVAIAAVPTAVTGFFGQNVGFPGFGKVTDFHVSVALIVLGAVFLYVMFRRKDWL